MIYPMINELQKGREILTQFGGYNHTLNAQEGEFFEMKNMTSDIYPILSNRKKRKFAYVESGAGDLVGIEAKDGLLLAYVEAIGTQMYALTCVWKKNDGTTDDVTNVFSLNTSFDLLCDRNLVKMGSKVYVFPDKIVADFETHTIDRMEQGVELGYLGTSCTIGYYDHGLRLLNMVWSPNVVADGDHDIVSNGGTGFKIVTYSKPTNMWVDYADPIVGIRIEDLTWAGIQKGDGVTITVEDTGDWDAESGEFVHVFGDFFDGKKEENGKSYRTTHKTVYALSEDGKTIFFRGMMGKAVYFNPSVQRPFVLNKDVPKMDYVCECNNRLWGCSSDGHEIYCSALGDGANWYNYEGASTDSWAATVGSDGKFTGAVNYLGNPIFFKENSMIKVTVSGIGAHAYREVTCRGVQSGSSKSVCVLDEILYYKSDNCICAYTGTVPFTISDNFGDKKYKEAVGGGTDGKYYISMKDADTDEQVLFCYTTSKQLWHKEDDLEVHSFVPLNQELYAFARDKSAGFNRMYLVSLFGGTIPNTDFTEEGKIPWMVESGYVGYADPNKKYVSRILMKVSLELGSIIDFYIKYDDSDVWTHKGNVIGKGTRSFVLPIIPRRCEHFKYMIRGTGNAKIISIAKTMESGSDS